MEDSLPGGEWVVHLYHAVLTRSVRIYWLLEELGIQYAIVPVVFTPPDRPGGVRSEKTPEHLAVSPLGKVPAIRDGDVTMFESGAILEYLIERYGNGRFAPKPGERQRGAYLQWVHFAEATFQRALDDIFSHEHARAQEERILSVATDARERATAAVDVLESALNGRNYLLGAELSGADIMMGYTLLSSKYFGVLTDQRRNASAYLAHLLARPAFRKALSP